MSSQFTPTERPEPALITETTSNPPEDPNRLRALETAVVGLLTIQLVIGDEWFVSGLTKLWRGGFDELRETSQGVTGWYRSILDSVVIPHGWAAGWFILAVELAVGAALLGTATVFLMRRHRLRFSTRPRGYA